MDILDHLSLTFQFPNDIVVNFEANQLTPPGFSHVGEEFTGTKSTVAVSRQRMIHYTAPKQQEEILSKRDITVDALEDFLSHIQNGNPPRTSPSARRSAHFLRFSVERQFTRAKKLLGRVNSATSERNHRIAGEVGQGNSVYPGRMECRMSSICCATLLSFSRLKAQRPVSCVVQKADPGWTAVRGTATPDATVLHSDRKSLRLEPAPGGTGPVVRFAPVPLTIGKSYELSGWVRTEDLAGARPRPLAHRHRRRAHDGVHALRRALGVAGRHAPTGRASRCASSPAAPRISILLTAGSGGAFTGKAWFEGVSLDEASAADSWPARDAVQHIRPRLPLSRRPAGSTCISKASPTSAATSTAT